jgi:hypothetical protein
MIIPCIELLLIFGSSFFFGVSITLGYNGIRYLIM